MLKSLGLIQIAVLALVAVLFFMTWDFGRRIVENAQLVEAARVANAELTHVRQVNATLKQLKKDVTTDDWVIKKARVDLHYAQENETLFIPASTPSAPAAPAAPPQAVPPPRPAWQDWLELIFGPSQ
jgi:cell division protein FtsB